MFVTWNEKKKLHRDEVNVWELPHKRLFQTFLLKLYNLLIKQQQQHYMYSLGSYRAVQPQRDHHHKEDNRKEGGAHHVSNSLWVGYEE